MLYMSDISLHGKRVLIREDLNVPMHQGHMTDDTRLKAVIPTIKKAIESKAKIAILSHLGQPKAGETDPHYSLKSLVEPLSQLLNYPVRFNADWINNLNLSSDYLTLCENVRFLPGETANDPILAKRMASLCDVFIMDAFATIHREHASTLGLATHAPKACIGLLLEQEIKSLDKALANPKKPVVAIVGGSKISTKLPLLKTFIKIADYLLLGGGIANTLLKANGYSIGTSLHESSSLEEAKQLLKEAEKYSCQIPLIKDAVVAKACKENIPTQVIQLKDIQSDDMVLDIGPNTAEYFSDKISNAKTIIWNGPMGVFEIASFANGTKTLAHSIASSGAYSIAGGGDTLLAIHQLGIESKISYISTGGGAFLAYCADRNLPTLSALQSKKL